MEPGLGADDLAERIGGYDVLVVRGTQVGRPVIEAADRLALVIRAGAGTNTIDTDAAAERAVFVSNVPGRNAAAVAELTMGLLLAVDRRIADNVADLRAGRWDKKTYGKAEGLLGSTMGIVGLGSIGFLVAERAAAFGIQVQADRKEGPIAGTSRRGPRSSGSRCAAPWRSCSHLRHRLAARARRAPRPSTWSTRPSSARMRRGAILLNTSRGDVVDEAALLEALDEGRVRAGLDVFDDEPGSGRPSGSRPSPSTPAVVATHHIGASTAQAQRAIAQGVTEIVDAFTAGEARHCVNLAPDRLGVERARPSATSTASGCWRRCSTCSVRRTSTSSTWSTGSSAAARPRSRSSTWRGRPRRSCWTPCARSRTCSASRWWRSTRMPGPRHDHRPPLLRTRRPAGHRPGAPCPPCRTRRTSRASTSTGSPSTPRRTTTRRSRCTSIASVAATRRTPGWSATWPCRPSPTGRVRGHEAVHQVRVDALVWHHSRTHAAPALVMLLHRAGPEFTRVVAEAQQTEPVLDFAGPQGFQQTVWRLDDGPATAALVDELAVAQLYIADGHHRSAAAARGVAGRRQAARGRPAVRAAPDGRPEPVRVPPPGLRAGRPRAPARAARRGVRRTRGLRPADAVDWIAGRVRRVPLVPGRAPHPALRRGRPRPDDPADPRARPPRPGPTRPGPDRRHRARHRSARRARRTLRHRPGRALHAGSATAGGADPRGRCRRGHAGQDDVLRAQAGRRDLPAPLSRTTGDRRAIRDP